MKENYNIYLANAKATLAEIGYLTDKDRLTIEKGICFLINGRHLLKSNDPETLRQAAELLLIGGYYLGGQCLVSDSEREFHKRKKSAKGGSKKSPATQAWKDWAIVIIERHPAVKPSAMTNSLLAEKSKPSNLPGYDHLIRFVRLARKQIAANKGNVRLVHST
jgi:hypothetical protein